MSKQRTISTEAQLRQAATAHKPAPITYRMLKHGELYVQDGMEAYENKYRERLLHNLKKTAATLGFELTPTHHFAPSVS